MAGSFHPPGPPAKPPLDGVDLATSIAALIATMILGAAAGGMGMFSMAFLDSCPPDSCSATGAFKSVATALAVSAAIGLTGLITTAVRLTRRKRAWPFAVGTLVMCTGVCIAGGAGFAFAVGFR
jgi:hypothetical protein